MKARLRTYHSETEYSDRLVDVRDETAFQDPYGDAVPFAVGSNQRIIPSDATPPPGTVASLAMRCLCPDTGALGDWLFVGPSHREPGSRVTPVYPDFAWLVQAEVMTGRWFQTPGDATEYVKR